MIRRQEFEVYEGEEVSGFWIASCNTLEEAKEQALQGAATSRKIYMVVEVSRRVLGVMDPKGRL